ncbi:MAG: hypothetical protein COT17_00140 [Elusimicrobia bacterium CG08_land_8_20_14_0_20_51_18]|nr:MAG: hypothetical protein COT17_00140 [Elusimicrobia bacterium CG08_land_8_20_14_0_20_51_18]
MKETKSVLMVIPTFYPVVGGSEKQCFELSSHLAAAGVKVVVLTRNAGQSPESEEINGFKIIRKKVFGPLFPDSLLFMAKVFLHILREKDSFDVVHAHMLTSAALAALIAGKLSGKKTVFKLAGGKGVDEISLSEKKFSGKIKLFLLKLFKPKLLVMNREVFDWLKSGPYREIPLELFKNGVDTSRYRTPLLDEKNRAKEKLNAYSTNLLFVGRLSPEKRMKEFIEIFSEILCDQTYKENIKLLIVGSGPQEAEIRGAVKALGLGENVIMFGHKYELLDYYWASEIFILPSVSEGLSNSMLEALSCGLAILAGKVGAARDLIKEGENGWLFDPFNRNEIKLCLKKAIENKNLKDISDRNRALAVNNYSMNAVAKELLKIYGE